MPEALQAAAPTESTELAQEQQPELRQPDDLVNKPTEAAPEFKRLRGVYAILAFISATVFDLFSAFPVVGTIYINAASLIFFFMGIRAKNGKSIIATQIGASISELTPFISWLPMCLGFITVIYIRGIIEERAAEATSQR